MDTMACRDPERDLLPSNLLVWPLLGRWQAAELPAGMTYHQLLLLTLELAETGAVYNVVCSDQGC